MSMIPGLSLRAGGWGLGAGVFPPANMSMIPGLTLSYETFGDHNREKFKFNICSR